MVPAVKTDVLFLRRVLMTLLFAATFAGGMVGITTVHAMTNQGSCAFFCSN